MGVPVWFSSCGSRPRHLALFKGLTSRHVCLTLHLCAAFGVSPGRGPAVPDAALHGEREHTPL